MALNGRRIEEFSDDLVDFGDVGGVVILGGQKKNLADIEAKLATLAEVRGSATLAARRGVSFGTFAAFLEFFVKAGKGMHWNLMVDSRMSIRLLSKCRHQQQTLDYDTC